MVRGSLILTLVTGLNILSSLASDPNSQKQPWRNPKDGMIFVWIQEGSFMVEVPDHEKDSEKTSLERLTFPQGFWLGQTEVTVLQFRRFVRERNYVTDAEKAHNRFNWRNPGFKQAGNHPVVYLSYEDAIRYAEWAGVDLPTEAEWFYACRAGTTTRFYWGDEVDDRFLWHRENSGDGTRAVARKLPNAWGLYDMVGNAWEYGKVCETTRSLLGGSWTRCLKYRTRQGFIAENLIGETVEPRLHKCEPGQTYPWDDDRGFRCIKRKGSPAGHPLPASWSR
jgi:formylglycine-generating enzyme required for sulfatase activity